MSGLTIINKKYDKISRFDAIYGFTYIPEIYPQYNTRRIIEVKKGLFKDKVIITDETFLEYTDK